MIEELCRIGRPKKKEQKMSTPMTAKLKITSVLATEGGGEVLKYRAVCKSDGYSQSDLDENNSYAKASPMADLEIHVHNPALQGKYRPGDTFKVHFEPCDG